MADRFHSLLWGFALVLVTVTAVPAQQGAPPDEVRRQILRQEARLDSVSRRGEVDAYADLFTEDVIISLGLVDDIRGRDALRAALVGFYQRNTVQAHQLTQVELAVYGARAFERGTYLWIAGPRGQSPTTERGRYAAEWRRDADGAWRIRRYLENLLPDSAATP